MTVDLLIEAAGDDRSLAADMLEALDAVTPHPLMFSVFVDGAEWTAGDERVAPVYRHNRKPEEIAAVFGNAILKATRAA